MWRARTNSLFFNMQRGIINIMYIFSLTMLATLLASSLVSAQYEEHFVHMPALIWSTGHQLSLAPSCTLSAEKIITDFTSLSQKKEFYHTAAKQMLSQPDKKHDLYFSMLSDPTPNLSKIPHTKYGDLIILEKPLGGCRLFQEQPSNHHDKLMAATQTGDTFIPILLKSHRPETNAEWSFRLIANVVFNVLRNEMTKGTSPSEPIQKPLAAKILKLFQDFPRKPQVTPCFTDLSDGQLNSFCFSLLDDFCSSILENLDTPPSCPEQIPLDNKAFFSGMKRFLKMFTSNTPMSSEEILATYHDLIHHSDTADDLYALPITDLVCMADYIHNGHHNPTVIVRAIQNASPSLLPSEKSTISQTVIEKAQSIFKLAWIDAKWDPETLQADLTNIAPTLSHDILHTPEAIQHIKELSTQAIKEAIQALSQARAEAQNRSTHDLVLRTQDPETLLFSKQAQFWSFALGVHAPPQTFKQKRITDNVIFITPSVAGCSFFYTPQYKGFDAILQMNKEYSSFPKVPLHLQTSTVDETTNHYVILLNILMDIARLDLKKGLNHAKQASLRLHSRNLENPQDTFQKTIQLLQELPEDYHCILNALPTTLADTTFEENTHHRGLHQWAYTLISALDHNKIPTCAYAATKFQGVWSTAGMPDVQIDDLLVQTDWKNYCTSPADMLPADSRMIKAVFSSLKALAQTPQERKMSSSKKYRPNQ